jgi:type VI secretion system protein VasG
VDHILTGTLLPELSGEFLQRMAAGEGIGEVKVSCDGDGRFEYQIT